VVRVARLRFLLRPGWLALLFTVLVFAAACFWFLSPWQFRVSAQWQTKKNAVISAEHHPARPIAELLPNGTAPEKQQNWREVRVRGHYLPRDEAVARLRSVHGNPADEVVTAFQPDSGPAMLVDRGYITPHNGAIPPYPQAPGGEVSLVARVHTSEPPDQDNRKPFVGNGHLQVYKINSSSIGRSLGTAVRPGYFTLTTGQPGGLGVLPLPSLSAPRPYFSYALQWIAFGVMSLLGLGYFTWRELKPGGALTAEGRAKRAQERAERSGERSSERPRETRGRRKVAALVAEDEAAEREAAEAEGAGTER
jgi:cytochrome oxidase assembly protein ShyY1